MTEIEIRELKKLIDPVLVEQTDQLVKDERVLLIRILWHLREIERRRLFSDYKFKSMHEMCVKHFKYSDDQAYRRMAAAKLLEELPEIENLIQDGDLCLTSINIAQTLFSQEKRSGQAMPAEKKKEILEQISGKSTREAQRITFSLSSQPERLIPDRVHFITNETVEMKFTASAELPRKIEKLKGYMAHKHPNQKLGELIERAIDEALKNWDPSAAIRKPRSKRETFAKAQSQCEICGSTHALEIDHIQPKAMGGSDEKENLRTLCKSCNQRAAIKTYGQRKMDNYIN